MPNETITYEFKALVSDALKDLKSFSDQFKETGSKASAAAKEISSALKANEKDSKKVSNVFANLSKSLNEVSKSFKTASSEGNVFKKLLTGIAGIQIGKWAADATKSAISYVETLNLFKVAMKENYDAGRDFIDTMAEMYGLDPKTLMDATGLFYEMAVAVDVPSEAAQQLSTNLTALSTDIASLFNYDVEQVSDNMISGIRGMSRAVVKYGLDLRAATIENYAMELGIQGSYATMNEASREILRYLVILEQTTDAQGDFARTIESPANQLRVFKEQIQQLSRTIGTIFLQPLQKVLFVINGIIMAVRILIQTFAGLFGLKFDDSSLGGISGELSSAEDSVDGLAGGVDSVGDAASDTAKQLKNMLAPFDELNVIQQETPETANTDTGSTSVTSGWGDIDPKLLEELENVQYTLENVRMKALDVRDAILEFFGLEWDGSNWEYIPGVFEKNLIDKLPGWKKSIQALFDVDWSDVGIQLSTIWDTLKEIASLTLGTIADDFRAIFGTSLDEALAQFITDLPGNLEDINSWLQENKDTIARIAATIIEVWLAVQVFSGLKSLLSPVIGVVTGIAGAFVGVISKITAIPTVISSVSGVLSSFAGSITALFSNPLVLAIAAVVAAFVGGFVKLYERSEGFREQVATLVSNIGTMLLQIVDTVSAMVSAVGDLLGTLGTLFLGSFEVAFSVIAKYMEPLYTGVVGILNALVEFITGVFEILEGIFTGDTETIMQGFQKIIEGALMAIITFVVTIINSILSAIFAAINFIGNLIYEFISGIIDAANMVADLIGQEIPKPDKSVFVFEEIPQLPVPSIKMANGGVVTGPTRAWVGEGSYDEAVIPLGDSPQLADMLDKFAGVVQAQNGSGETIVKVYIGGKEWDAFTYKSSKRGEKIVGKQPVKESAYA